MINITTGKMPFNLAIVGGGRTCKFFLELLQLESVSYLQIKIIGVCDINPMAEGFKIAQDMGIYTTTDFRDLLKLKDLDGIMELTNNQDVLLELIQLRPKRAVILEHNIGRLLRRLFTVDQKLRSAEQQVILEKTISDFLIEQAKQRIVVLNSDFTIAEANEPYLKAVNKSRSEVIGTYCYQVVHDFDVPCADSLAGLECPMLKTLRTGEASQVIHPDPTADYPDAYSDIVTCPVKDSNGEIVRVIEIWRDITQELSHRWEKREHELKSDLNKLVQEDRLISLGKLAASCVHEINNPIQGLLTFSHLMQDLLSKNSIGKGEMAQLREFTSLMSDELERCGNIISGLLSFSRESSMKLQDVNLYDLISTVVGITRHKMGLQDIHVKIDSVPEALWIRGETARLQQCFLNIIFNAIEAMPSGGQLDIVLKAVYEKNTARVEISDTGQGIPEENMGNIFDPFFTTKELGEGTGLGLSIVYGVVKNHGGDVKVRPQSGKGTTFILHFPLVLDTTTQEATNG